MRDNIFSFFKGLFIGVILLFMINIPYFVGKINEINTIRTMEEFNLATDSDIEYCLQAHFYDITWDVPFSYSNRYESGWKAIKQTFFKSS